MKFRSLFRATQLAGTPIKIRVPMIFRNSYLEDSKHANDDGKIHPDRLQPPFLQLPGFKICYEGLSFDPTAGRLPYYCYLAAVPSQPGGADALAKEMQEKLKEKFKDTPAEWEEVDAESPTTKAVHWKKIRVVADQPFRYFTARGIVTKDFPGIFELWIRDEKDYTVLVAWRSPSSVEGPSTAPVVATSPVASALAAPPSDSKVDLSAMPALTAGTITVDESAPTEK
jgi:hypothetical protein